MYFLLFSEFLGHQWVWFVCMLPSCHGKPPGSNHSGEAQMLCCFFPLCAMLLEKTSITGSRPKAFWSESCCCFNDCPYLGLFISSFYPSNNKCKLHVSFKSTYLLLSGRAICSNAPGANSHFLHFIYWTNLLPCHLFEDSPRGHFNSSKRSVLMCIWAGLKWKNPWVFTGRLFLRVISDTYRLWVWHLTKHTCSRKVNKAYYKHVLVSKHGLPAIRKVRQLSQSVKWKGPFMLQFSD